MAFVFAAVCTPVLAQGWEISPSIYASVLATDNVGLTPDALKESDRSYELSPQLVLNREGPRLQLNSFYRMQARRFDENDQNDQIFHNLNLSSNLVAVEDRVGVYALANISQQLIDRSQGIGVTTANRVGNQTDVGTYSIEPYLNFAAGSSTVGRVSFRSGLVEFDAPELRDSKDNRFSALVSSNPSNLPVSIGAAFSTTDVEFDTGREITLTRTSIDLGYSVSPRADFVVTLGNDDNDLGPVPTVAESDGFFWLAGVSGSLDDATDYEVRVGEQFFGDSYLLEFNRTRGRLALNVSYNEQATTFGSSQLGGLGGLGALGGQQGTAPQSYDALLRQFADVGGIDLPDVSQDVFVSKRLNVGATYTMAKSSWQLNIFNDKREYVTTLDGGLEDGGTGAALRWMWQASSRMNVALSANWQQFEIRNTGEEPDDIRLEASVRRNLLGNSYADLRLIHNERKGSDASRDFSENSVIVGAGYEF